MKVLRQATQAEKETVFKFDVKGVDFTVKNFTDGNIFVSDVTPVDKGKSILIPAQAGQDITMGATNTFGLTAVDTLYILAEASGNTGVEVQMISW